MSFLKNLFRRAEAPETNTKTENKGAERNMTTAKDIVKMIKEEDIKFDDDDLPYIDEEDTEYDDTDFVAELAAYLFAKSRNPYFIIHRAAYDNSGGYSHQCIGRRKDGAVVVEYLPDFLDNLWNEPAAAVFV